MSVLLVPAGVWGESSRSRRRRLLRLALCGEPGGSGPRGFDRRRPQPTKNRHRPRGGIPHADCQHRGAAEGLGGDRRQTNALSPHGYRP